jgi:hypothetical protein
LRQKEHLATFALRSGRRLRECKQCNWHGAYEANKNAKNAGIESPGLGHYRGRLGDPRGRLCDLRGRLSDPMGHLGDTSGCLGHPRGHLGHPRGHLGHPRGVGATPGGVLVTTGGIWATVWQGVAMDSLKFHPRPPCPTLLRFVLGVFRPQGG